MKGFIFSIDAAVALISVMLLAMLFALQVNEPGYESNAYEISGATARDAATVGNYLGKNASDIGLDSSMPIGKKNAACVVSYEFKATAPYVSDANYCKGI